MGIAGVLMSQMVYFTPKRGKRKGFFYRKSYLLACFCQRSLEDENEPPEGPGDQVQQPPDPGAQKEKVPGAAQGQGGHGVEPDLAVLPKGGRQEKGQDHHQPEGEVQGAPKGPEGEEEPGKAQKVVQQPQRPSDGQAQQKDLGLEKGGEGQAHPRKRRLRKLAWRGSSSS